MVSLLLLVLLARVFEQLFTVELTPFIKLILLAFILGGS